MARKSHNFFAPPAPLFLLSRLRLSDFCQVPPAPDFSSSFFLQFSPAPVLNLSGSSGSLTFSSSSKSDFNEKFTKKFGEFYLININNELLICSILNILMIYLPY